MSSRNLVSRTFPQFYQSMLTAMPPGHTDKVLEAGVKTSYVHSSISIYLSCVKLHVDVEMELEEETDGKCHFVVILGGLTATVTRSQLCR